MVAAGRPSLVLIRALAHAGIAIAASAAVAIASASVPPGIRAETVSSAQAPSAAAQARLGRAIFFDPSLSGSGRMACATCHDPAHAYGPPDSRAVQTGGLDLQRPGTRAVPSLRYVLNRTPRWNKAYVANPAERILEGDEPPSGGFGWDGRFDSLRTQAQLPLLAANEMANGSPDQLVARLQHASYAGEFRRVFGERIFDDSRQAYAAALRALERFELDDPTLRPYSSKYDDYLDGRAQLTAQELRGLALFEDPRRGNCASCHPDRKGMDGSHPLFTDYQYEAIGVPRNPEVPANAAPGYFDEGVCGPLRTDQSGEAKYCGLFKTPTLRNVAIRGAYFHNGRFHSLSDALRFYVQRDTDAAKWYPTSSAGEVDKFDDLPRDLRVNVDVKDPPLTQQAGGSPVWTDADIEDVLAFLGTLTDRDAQPACGAARCSHLP